MRPEGFFPSDRSLATDRLVGISVLLEFPESRTFLFVRSLFLAVEISIKVFSQVVYEVTRTPFLWGPLECIGVLFAVKLLLGLVLAVKTAVLVALTSGVVSGLLSLLLTKTFSTFARLAAH